MMRYNLWLPAKVREEERGSGFAGHRWQEGGKKLVRTVSRGGTPIVRSRASKACASRYWCSASLAAASRRQASRVSTEHQLRLTASLPDSSGRVPASFS